MNGWGTHYWLQALGGVPCDDMITILAHAGEQPRLLYAPHEHPLPVRGYQNSELLKYGLELTIVKDARGMGGGRLLLLWYKKPPA